MSSMSTAAWSTSVWRCLGVNVPVWARNWGRVWTAMTDLLRMDVVEHRAAGGGADTCLDAVILGKNIAVLDAEVCGHPTLVCLPSESHRGQVSASLTTLKVMRMVARSTRSPAGTFWLHTFQSR